MRKLKRLFRPLKDPRASNARHDLVEILVIALAATLAGAKTCTEFEYFGKGREELLRRFLELRCGIPSHDTFSNVFRALDPKGLEAILRKFSKSFGVKGVVSIDGKALRGAFARGRQATPLHMVNVWAAGTRMALAQRKAPNRNEVAGVLEVLALLDLDGAIVTADALHCRPDTAQAIRDRKGHYVLAIKSNRGRLFKAAKVLLDTARRPARASQRRTSAHGRVERRQAIVAPAPQLAKQYGFPAIAAVGRIDSWRANAGKSAKKTARYFLASRLLSAKKLLDVVRAHWSIENNLHWVLDVLFDEDACRSRKDHAAENLAATDGADAELVAAGWLHDTVEDDLATRAELAAEFGERVAALVDEVTDDMSLPQAKRRHQQVVDAPHKSPGAKLIKIADKISNVCARIHADPTSEQRSDLAAYTMWAEDVVAGCRGVNPKLDARFDEAVRAAKSAR